MVTIVQKDNPVLRSIAAEVPLEEIATPKIQEVLSRMQEALDSQDDGVAIAAPQIGVSLRIFLVSGKVLHRALRGKKGAPQSQTSDMVFINPVFVKLSKSKKKMSEGCLSVRYLYGDVSRSTKATIRAYNEHGEIFERGASGLLAQIFQHETDHLNGILFIDTAENIEDLPPESETNPL